MSIESDLLKFVPNGESNAISARIIWEQLGMWSILSVRHKLNEMAAAGTIRRKKIEQAGGPLYLYFKQLD